MATKKTLYVQLPDDQFATVTTGVSYTCALVVEVPPADGPGAGPARDDHRRRVLKFLKLDDDFGTGTLRTSYVVLRSYADRADADARHARLSVSKGFRSQVVPVIGADQYEAVMAARGAKLHTFAQMQADGVEHVPALAAPATPAAGDGPVTIDPRTMADLITAVSGSLQSREAHRKADEIMARRAAALDAMPDEHAAEDAAAAEADADAGSPYGPRNLVSVRGGKVHLSPSHTADAQNPLPACRVWEGRGLTYFRFTDAPVTCAHCRERQTSAVAAGRMAPPAPSGLLDEVKTARAADQAAVAAAVARVSSRAPLFADHDDAAASAEFAAAVSRLLTPAGGIRALTPPARFAAATAAALAPDADQEARDDAARAVALRMSKNATVVPVPDRKASKVVIHMHMGSGRRARVTVPTADGRQLVARMSYNYGKRRYAVAGQYPGGAVLEFTSGSKERAALGFARLAGVTADRYAVQIHL